MNRTRQHHCTARRGFTLIETIAAIVILAVAIPPMVWAVSEAHAQRMTPVQISTARWLAAERLEQIIADRHGAVGYGNLAYANESSVAGFPGYSRSVSIVETGPNLTSAGQGYKRVTVSVSFSSRHGQQTFSLSTVLTDLDL